MNSRNKFLKFAFNILVIFVLANVLVVSKKYVNQILTLKEFYVFFTILALLVVCIWRDSRNKKALPVKLNTPDMLVLLYTIYVTINSIVLHPLVLTTPVFINTWMICLFYFSIRWLLSNQYITTRFIYTACIVILVIEVAWVYLQHFGIVKSFHTGFAITGSFENPGPLTTYLASLLPLVFVFFLLPKEKAIVKGPALLFVLLIVLILIISHQRASWIGGFVSIVVLLIFRFYNKIKKPADKPIVLYPAIVIILVFMVISGIFLYQHKIESSKGRIFIWKHCIQLIADKPVAGQGFENYLIPYNTMQAGYFEQHPDDWDNAMLVDNIEFAFNEYLQWGVELGIIGIILFLLMVGAGIRKCLKSPPDIYKYAACTGIIAILIMSFVTYPFHTLSVHVSFTLLLAIINTEKEAKPVLSLPVNRRLKLFLYSLFIIGMAYVSIIQNKRMQAQKEWKNLAFEIKRSTYYRDIFHRYKELMPILSYDRYFLYNYAAELSLREQFKESIPVFEATLTKINDSDTYLYLGNSYEGLGEYAKAENCFRKAMYLIPHRFYTRYRLVKLLQITGREQEALAEVKTILTMPVKVQSEVVSSILQEMRQFYASAVAIPDTFKSEQLIYTLTSAEEKMPGYMQLLEDYARIPSDSLKLKAAIFLMENMIVHYYFTSGFDKIYTKYFSNMPAGRTEKFVLWDSVKHEVKENIPQPQIKYDIKQLSADYLRRNVDSAFSTWSHVPWKDDYSFEQFCLYVLPYRVCNEPPENWRAFFKKELHDVWDSIQAGMPADKAFAIINNRIDKTYIIVSDFPYEQDLSVTMLYKGNIGSCRQMTIMQVLAMRALGIPCVFDFTPAWANRAKGHDWATFIDPEGHTRLVLEHEPIPYRHKRVHSTRMAVSDTILLLKEELSDPGIMGTLRKAGLQYIVLDPDLMKHDIPVYPQKKVAKVYRHTFEINYTMNDYINALGGKVVEPFNSVYMNDVTEDYIKTPNGIRLQFWTPENPYQYGYVGVFNRSNHITPVDKAMVEENNILTFRNLGIEILYFPVYIENNQLIIAGEPFILEKEGSVRFIPQVDNTKTVTLTLTRKYPLFINILFHAQKLYKGKLQGSDNPEFNDATDLYTLNYTPLYTTRLNVNTPQPYRYYRFRFDRKVDISLAEFHLYTRDEKGAEMELQGRPVGEPGDGNKPSSYAFDNNIETYFFKKGYSAYGWIGLDMGTPKKVSTFRVCPRNDSNSILPGNDYELMYWDNGWRSAGIKKAEEYTLMYENIPSHTLYWLKCLSGGAEERPFTYENGVQVWW